MRASLTESREQTAHKIAQPTDQLDPFFRDGRPFHPPVQFYHDLARRPLSAMDDDTNKGEATPREMGLAGADDGVAVPPGTAPGLGDMPCEILDRIVAFIDHPRHLLLLRRASPLFDQANPAAAAIAWGAQRMHRLLRAGAPLDVVASALAVRNRPLYATAVVHAVKGRRLAVVRAVFETIAVCRPSCSLFFFSFYLFFFSMSLCFSFFFFFLCPFASFPFFFLCGRATVFFAR